MAGLMWGGGMREWRVAVGVEAVRDGLWAGGMAWCGAEARATVRDGRRSGRAEGPGRGASPGRRSDPLRSRAKPTKRPAGDVRQAGEK